MNPPRVLITLVLTVGTGYAALLRPEVVRPVIEHLASGTVLVMIGWLLNDYSRSPNGPPGGFPH